MEKVFLNRFETKETGTTGRLKLPTPKLLNLCTLELPWKDNQGHVSCIPFGIYVMRQVLSPKFGRTYEICDVPNRTHVLFHSGAYLKHTHGCILVGYRHFVRNGEDALADGHKAFYDMLEVLTAREYELEIR